MPPWDHLWHHPCAAPRPPFGRPPFTTSFGINFYLPGSFVPPAMWVIGAYYAFGMAISLLHAPTFLFLLDYDVTVFLMKIQTHPPTGSTTFSFTLISTASRWSWKVVPRREILGTSVDTEHRRVELVLPKHSISLRSPGAVSSTRRNTQGLTTCVYLVCRLSWPKETIAPQVCKLLQLYCERGFSETALQNASQSVLRKFAIRWRQVSHP